MPIKPVALALLCLLLLATAADAAEDFPRGQLPGTVVPLHYRLLLDLDPRKPDFSGDVRIRLRLTEPAEGIWLHGLDLTVQGVELHTGGKTVPGRWRLVEPLHGVARIDFDTEQPAGEAELRIRYTGTYREGAEGIYRLKAGEDWYLFTQMEPMDARRAFPGFDEPRFKTPFELSVRAIAGDVVIANAPEAGLESLPDGRRLHRFQPTLPLPTYLFALAVGPLDVVESSVPAQGVRKTALPLRGVATRGQGPRLAFALRETPRILTWLEDWFGSPHPYPKLDLIASPQMGGAMENAGAITFADSLLLLDEDAPLVQLSGFYEVMAHELAHQWFGNLVTPAWWEDIWLNEAFASWMGVKTAAALRPELGNAADAAIDLTWAMELDSLRAGRPIRQRVTDNREVAGTFDGITYQKGGGVLGMVESYLGEATFREGVRLHLSRRPHGVADSEDFFTAMSDVAAQPALMAAFRSFVEQPGVPMLRMRREGDALRLVQSRYRPIGSTLAADQMWRIPVCVNARLGTGATEKRCALLGETSGTLALPGGSTVVMPNAGGAGYYRFGMDAADLNALLALAHELPEAEATVLASAIGAGFVAGDVPASLFMEAATVFAAHPRRVPSVTLGMQLDGIAKRWAPPEARAAIALRMRTLYADRLAGLGLDPRAGAYAAETGETRLLRRYLASFVADLGRDPATRAVLAKAAEASLTDPAALDPEYRGLAWTVGVQERGAGFANALEERMFTSQDALLRRHAAGAIGSAEDPAIAARARELWTDPRIRVGELFALLSRQFNSPVTREAAWSHLEANFDAVLGKLPGFSKDMVFGVPEAFCDARLRPGIARTLQTRSQAIGSGALEVERALESIDLCIAQREALWEGVSRTL